MNIDTHDKETGRYSFPSKFDVAGISSTVIIQKLFEDNNYTESKLNKAKRLLKLPKKMDNLYVCLLVDFVIYELGHYKSAYEFPILPNAVCDKALSDLADMGYLVKDDNPNNYEGTLPDYTLEPTVLKNLIETGTLSKVKSFNKKTDNKATVKNKYLLSHEKIKKVKLIYEDSLIKDLTRISDILVQDNLKKIQSRILEDNQHNGICISFYGPSGTGKTEKILQLAKESKRDVYNYKIADTESKYCGEKQRIINEMFSEFRDIREKYIKGGLPEPILLLNEADALFSKRHDEPDDVGSTATRENNQMQAELLDHIENFDGIMFITTNKIQNFDDAMERRLLFKIKFDKPSKKIQKQIWQAKFPSLQESDINSIVDKYNFTGGNINNVKKKLNIEYVLSGRKDNIEDIYDNCKNEEIDTKNKKVIGF